MSNLGKKAVKGFFWTGIDNFGNQILTLVFSIFLMRLLDPKDFGIVGQALSFVGFSQVLIDSGFGWALIQKKEIDKGYLSTVFWTNLIIGIALCGIFFLLAPYIERFYDNDGLTELVRVLSFGFIIASLNVVQRTIYQREIDFKRLSLINLTAFFSGNILAIILSYRGWQEWSLVAMYLGNFSIASILLWYFTSFKPSFEFSFAKLRELSAFSLNVLGLRSLDFVAAKGDKILIGKMLGDQALGIYETTFKLFIKSIVGLSNVFQKVLFPAFSKIQNQKDKIAQHLLMVLDLVSIFIFPLLVLGFFIAEPFILTLFGEKWSDMIFIFQTFCLISFFLALNPIITSTLLAINESKLVLHLDFFSKTILFISIFIGIKWGINGVAISWLVSVFINFMVRIHFSGKALNLSFLAFSKNIFFNALWSVLPTGVLYSFYFFGLFPEDDIQQLLVAIPAGGILILLLLYILRKKELTTLFNKVYKTKKTA